MVHVQMGMHHVGHRRKVDTGSRQPLGELPGPREARELAPQPGVDEYGLAAATHHEHVQRPIKRVRRQEPGLAPSPPHGRVDLGCQTPDWLRDNPMTITTPDVSSYPHT